jgi:UDP-N-acetylglucosamine 2-epimerase
MPYQIKSIENKIIYVHQHGLQSLPGDRAQSIPKYAPVNYFTYGRYWNKYFRMKSHPDSNIISVGNSRFDDLFKQDKEHTEIDVLFISGTHALEWPAFDEKKYKSLIDTVTNICEQNDWNMRIKLHPRESDKYYSEWGYEKYITKSKDIENLLLKSDIAVTDASSAFIESLLLNTPVIFAQYSIDILQMDRPDTIEGISFPEDLEQLSKDLTQMKGDSVNKKKLSQSSMFKLGDSTQNVMKAVKQDNN